MEWVGAAHPDSDVELWAQDEARLGLHPVQRAIWSQLGQRPIAIGKILYKWLYIYGFVHPQSGRVVWLLLPKMNAALMSLALKLFAQEIGAGSDKQIVLFLDSAPSHVAKNLVIPEGIHLVFQPPYSPEVQPSEHLWPLHREAIANKLIEDLDQLEEIIINRCQELDQQPDLIRSTTLFHWWPEDIVRP